MAQIIHQQIIEAIQELPSKSLPELANFIEYLRFKNASASEPRSSGSSFLLGIAGLGSTVESALAERDEEILSREVSPLHGWSIKPEMQI
ncbi:hypothetical protein [Pseudanabaena sp. PCC 6802]|uniref:hypothetical protein n=1 Tax=Pseudanabaena sp. PCC 6802 TaxID=118173 RepID=UPI00034B6451|nr:hypothetical protein [Pseudanabaena sp. PCC 6802]